MLMELCEYSKEEIDSTENNSYSRMVIKELLNNCNLVELNFISKLNKKDKNRVFKVKKIILKITKKKLKNKRSQLIILKKYLLKKNDFLVVVFQYFLMKN